MKNSEPSKKGFFGRVSSYGARRIRNPVLSAASRQHIKSAAGQAREAIRPEKISAQDFSDGYYGRYEDGGVARFDELVESEALSSADLLARKANHRRGALIFAIAGLSTFILAFYMAWATPGFLALLSGLCLTIIGFGFLALAVKLDFSAWQISQRRFGGFSEYLTARF